MTHHVRIKICGVRDQIALDTAVEAGADFIGFVRWPGSPRFVEAEEAAGLAASLPRQVEPVGLFVNAPIREILDWPHQWVQLHGDEDETVAAALRAEGRNVIRGFRFEEGQVARWDGCAAVDRLLVDGSSVGGTGEAFDHDALARILPTTETPILVAGGLSPENVARVVHDCRPWGVDVSSGVESSRGVKDPERIESFCRAARTGLADR